MLTDPSIEKLKTKTNSSYDLVMLVSERARQLVDGAQPLVPSDDAPNAVSLACREIVYNQHNVRFQWVKGHNGVPLNERCDQLATTSAQTPTQIDTGYENLQTDNSLPL